MRTKTAVTAVILVSFVLTASAKDKEKPPKISTLDLTCETFQDPHDKVVCFQAKAKEFQDAAKAARKAAIKAEPKSMQQIRKQEESVAKKQARAEKEVREAHAHAHITGCPPDWEVWLDPKAFRATGSNLHARVNAVNVSAFAPIEEIRDDVTGKVIVKNLCPKGRISLDKSIVSMPFGVISMQTSFTAIGDVNGRVGESHSNPITISAYQADSQTLQPVQWDITLQVK